MDSNQNKYYTIYDKSEVIFQDKFKETILTTQSYIDRAGKSITNPPMNYVYNACCRARKAENQEQWKKRKRISSQLKYLTLMTKKACRTHSASNYDFCKVLPSM